VLVESAGRPQYWRLGLFIGGVRVSGAGWADSHSAFNVQGITYDGMSAPGPCALNCTNDHETYSFHPGGAHILLVDGSVHFLRTGTSIRTRGRLITAAGGEVLPPDAL